MYRIVSRGCLHLSQHYQTKQCSVPGLRALYTSAKRQDDTKYTVANLRPPDFTDTKSIYKSKTSRELWRAYFVFSLCSIDFLVDRQIKLLSWSRRLLGRGLFRRLMRSTIYGQFMAGETPEEVKAVAKRNSEAGLFTMLSYTASESHGAAKGTEEFAELQKDIFSKNLSSVFQCIEIAASCKDYSSMTPQLATKLTYFTSSDTLFVLNEVLNQQYQCMSTILGDVDVAKQKEFVDFAHDVIAKSAKEYADTGMAILQSSKGNSVHLPSLATNLPFTLALNSCQTDLQTFLKTPVTMVTLTPEQVQKIRDAWNYMDQLGQHTHKHGVTLIWDAEQTYLQNAIDCMTLDNMRKYNKDRPVIHNTYQCYLKRTYDIVVRDIDMGRREGFKVGFKVVRGAYMDEERRRAGDMNYEDPVNPTYSATTRMYEKVAEHLLETVKQSACASNYHVTFATHNDDTVKFVIENMIEKQTPVERKNVSFAQLLGMRDHISLALSNQGVLVAKLIHYGEVEECVAYLSRRLVENRSGLPTADVEKRLLRTELRRRRTDSTGSR